MSSDSRDKKNISVQEAYEMLKSYDEIIKAIGTIKYGELKTPKEYLTDAQLSGLQIPR